MMMKAKSADDYTSGGLTKPKETEACCRRPLRDPARKPIGPICAAPGNRIGR